MSDDIPNESDADSNEDTDFVMRKCGVCKDRAIGKSMTDCEECEQPICQNCWDDSEYIGCEKYDGFAVCSTCFETAYYGVKRYCARRNCDCDNVPPEVKEARKRESARLHGVMKAFKDSISITEWKKSHWPINYPSKHKNKYLIDLFFSEDSFESGYLKWLVEKANERPPNQSDENYNNFQRYRREAAEIMEKYTTFAESYNLQTRDHSPTRK